MKFNYYSFFYFLANKREIGMMENCIPYSLTIACSLIFYFLKKYIKNQVGQLVYKTHLRNVAHGGQGPP